MQIKKECSKAFTKYELAMYKFLITYCASMAPRKAVLARKEKAEERRQKVDLAEIKNDRSPMKRSSHVRLVTLTAQLKERGLMRLYKKVELQQLCGAYGIRWMAKWNKHRLVKNFLKR
jgi:hypothetical protein